MAATAAGRTAFARSCAELLSAHSLDGIDLDWEYPVSGGAPGTVHRPQDRQNFTLLLRAVRQALDRQGKRDGRDYQLTVAGAAGTWYLDNIQPADVAEIVDHIFLMAYDIHGPWDSYADFNAPLYPPSSPAPNHQSSVSGSAAAYLEQGVPADKLVLGMPLYGYRYNGVRGEGLYSLFTSARSIPYDALVETYLSDPAYRQFYHTEARVPYLRGRDSFLSYDDPRSIAEKAALAQELDLQGIGFWELSQDRTAVLIESAVAQLKGGTFSDVPADAWYAAAVAFVQARGWMTGTTPARFSPELPVTRGMAATVLHRMAGSPAAGDRAFPDVAEARGWMTGTTPARFSPELPVTRGMAATVLHRMAGSPAAGDRAFPDVAEDAYCRQAVAWAAEAGVVLGYDDGRFGPEDLVTREQLAALLYRYASFQGWDTSGRASLSGYTDAALVSPYARTAVSWAVDAGLLTGRSAAALVPDGTASRAELAVILERFSLCLPTA